MQNPSPSAWRSSQGELSPWPRRSSDEAIGPSRAAAESQTCPRCRTTAAAGSRQCEHCGYSFLETRVFDDDGVTPTSLQRRWGPTPPWLRGGEERTDPLVGTTVEGRYRVQSVLGEGGFGVVYKVEFLLFDDPVPFAMKVLHPQLCGDESFRLRFLREARLAMSLAHENIVQVREFGETAGGLLYFTMDYCEGASLAQLLREGGFVPLERALRIARGILEALVASHRRGILHRDLKPGNIFIEEDASGDERVRVGDFGLAKALRDGDLVSAATQDLTQGGIVGSPRYMSPEQAAGGDLDARSDLFTVGMILYEMLYGFAPTERQLEGGSEGLRKPASPSPRQHVPAAVFDVLRRALAVDPRQRFESAAQFLRAIDALPQSRRSPRRAAAHLRALVRTGARTALVLLVATLAWSGSYFLFNSPQVKNWTASLYDDVGLEAPPPAKPVELQATEHYDKALATDSGLALADDVAGYFPLEVGRTYTYRVFREGQTSGRVQARFRVAEEVSPGRFLVEALEDGQQLFWVVDPQENTVSQEFFLPDAQTGELRRTERRILLRLPRDPNVTRETFRNEVGGVASEVTVAAAPGPVTLHGETFEGCLKVVEREPSRQLTFVRYYQKWAGEVAYLVFDESRTRTCVYSRVLVTGSHR